MADDIIIELLRALLEGEIQDVLIGLHWTAVVAKTDDGSRCGLASTLTDPHYHHGKQDVPLAGKLQSLSGSELATMARSDRLTLASVGLAAINALLPHHPKAWIDVNAEEVLAKQGDGKKVALIGHFPFVEQLRNHVGELLVLEQDPRPGDLPASSAADIVPEADVVAITGTSVINHTFDELIAICSSKALVVLLGPSTPLCPILFDQGVDILCGSVVTSIEPVLKVIGQGGNFRQVRDSGVRTVTMYRPGLKWVQKGV